ncbi:H17B6-like protein [Mya arenaria]|uniref:H17B6-like protein n=1 Tax=Mya arenaria TaxID=6604 RepID=A0ABY7EKN2_MYAAR|nr:H17B6-like protein [Mya arenaria]
MRPSIFCKLYFPFPCMRPDNYIYMPNHVFSLVFFFVTYNIFDWIIRRGKVEHIAKKSVFINGCDTGFGNLLAKTLDQKGVVVYAGCLTNNGAEQLNKDTSSRLKTLILDVLDNGSITDAFRTIDQDVKDGGLLSVVNNAEVTSGLSSFECNPLAVLERTILVNLVGHMAVAYTFLPLLRKSGVRLVNVCSSFSFVAIPGIINQMKLMAHLNKAENVFPVTKFISLLHESNLSSPQDVADVMIRALLARRPRSRYLVDTDAKTL